MKGGYMTTLDKVKKLAENDNLVEDGFDMNDCPLYIDLEDEEVEYHIEDGELIDIDGESIGII